MSMWVHPQKVRQANIRLADKGIWVGEKHIPDANVQVRHDPQDLSSVRGRFSVSYWEFEFSGQVSPDKVFCEEFPVTLRYEEKCPAEVLCTLFAAVV